MKKQAIAIPRIDGRMGPSYAPIWGRLGKWGGFAMLALIYFPLVWLILLSISHNLLGGIPGAFWLERYRALFASSAWHKPMQPSLAIGLAIALICALCATIVGRALPNLSSPGKGIFLFVVPRLCPACRWGRPSSSWRARFWT